MLRFFNFRQQTRSRVWPQFVLLLQNKKKKFLIVTEREVDRDDYTKDLIQAYHNAIDEQNKQLDSQHALKIVGNYTLNHLPDKAILRKSQLDCVLYAGELEAAHGLLNIFPSPQPMVILSDSTLDSRGCPTTRSMNSLQHALLIRRMLPTTTTIPTYMVKTHIGLHSHN